MCVCYVNYANGKIPLHNINYVKLENNDENKKLMDELNNELIKKRVAWFNARVSSSVRDDSDFFDE